MLFFKANKRAAEGKRQEHIKELVANFVDNILLVSEQEGAIHHITMHSRGARISKFNGGRF
jgi:hypothetical protein